MTIEQIEKELLNKIAKLNGTHNLFQQGEIKQCEIVLDMISKFHPPTVSGAVCNSPCCNGKPKHEVKMPSEFYCEECFKQTDR